MNEIVLGVLTAVGYFAIAAFVCGFLRGLGKPGELGLLWPFIPFCWFGVVVGEWVYETGRSTGKKYRKWRAA